MGEESWSHRFVSVIIHTLNNSQYFWGGDSQKNRGKTGKCICKLKLRGMLDEKEITTIISLWNHGTVIGGM